MNENNPQPSMNSRQPVYPPLRRPRRNLSDMPWVSYTFMGLSILVFLAQYLTQNFLGYDLPATYGAKINAAIIYGQYWRLITPVLLHGSILHIGFNMYALYIIGPGLERYYGHGRFLALYLLSGFAGNVISFFMSPNTSLGASTAIFGLVAAEFVFVFQNRFLFGDRTRSILGNLVTVILVNFLLGLSPGIDNWGHLGGLMGGLAFAWLGGPIYEINGLAQRLQDTRSKVQVWTIGIVVAVVFGMLVVLKLYLG